ncbi:MAG TPA: protein phosphatase 2C domain-containing protein [Kofleriaceae bacterium]|nr:protein phosphatase 2C domain-containing protein [Kofleriaceae bacterium]
MDTKSAAAAVVGARHVRAGRNGQDAAAAWSDGDTGAIVVCDGCSAGAYSELGARLAAQLAIRCLRDALATVRPRDVWPAVRDVIGSELAALADQMLGDRAQIVHDHFLFTIVAAARRGDELAVWALGDGGYRIGDRTRVLGPFADNQPPYLGYDLLGDPQRAHVEVTDADAGLAIVATDGAVELGLAQFGSRRLVEHPDALRRQLAIAARAVERVAWDDQRIERTPAALQDDGAVAILRWR